MHRHNDHYVAFALYNDIELPFCQAPHHTVQIALKTFIASFNDDDDTQKPHIHRMNNREK